MLYCKREGFRKTNFVLVPAERHIYRNIIVFVLKLHRSGIFIKLALASNAPLELNTFFDLFSIKIALASASPLDLNTFSEIQAVPSVL